MEIRELLGQRDLSFAEATRILGARLGRPQLWYVQLPYADMAGLLQEADFSECLAGLYAELAQAINEGQVRSREGRRPSSTTATSFEAFVDKVINGTSCSLARTE
ncbi:hypothetical protein [Pseudomonas boanensis]|uniref:hypothetical protein n=1 Tax=Metapseudomonas boanensis TaxID=2822138 RepID=UPI0035D5132C